jgi:threonine dehydrogenase-like Zn-dependent dehydrogenase
MKALVYTGPHAFEMREVADPEPQTADEVLIRVEACGICGSDMHAWHGHDERRPAPLILGHEAVGRIADGPDAGRRVAVNPLVTCQRCEACLSGRDNLCPERQIISMTPRQGAFAQLIAMPRRNLVTVPEHVGFVAAALAEPLACGWHATRLASTALFRPLAEARALVIGGGAIGLGAALSLIRRGVGEIWLAETNEQRHGALKAAGEGAICVFSPRAKAAPRPNTFDLVVEAVGHAATRAMASAMVKSGGVIAHIGLKEGSGGLDIRRMTLQEITFIGTYTYTAQDFRETAAAIFEGSLGTLDWADVRPLSDGPAAFAAIDAGSASAPKIILTP